MHLPTQMEEFMRYFSSSSGTIEAEDFSRYGLNTELKYFKKGEYLIKQGEYAPNIYMLQKGLMRYFSVSIEGKEITQSFASAPGIAGSTRAMTMGTTALFSIEVLDDVLCFQFEWQHFFNTMKKQPGFLEAYSRLLEHMFIKKEEREYHLLQQSAEQRYLNFIDNHPQLGDKVPLKIIASCIGITPVALSRIRKKLQ